MNSKSNKTAIVWFRQDLRLSDNPALQAAIDSGAAVVPVYVLDDISPAKTRGRQDWSIGGAGRWWLHGSLKCLGKNLKKAGAQLILARGDAAVVIPDLVRETGADAVYWNRCYEPFAIARDTAIKSALTELEVNAESFKGSLIKEPWELKTGQGKHYGVFTPFWKSLLKTGVQDKPLAAPTKIRASRATLTSLSLDDLDLLPSKPDWAAGFREYWTPGEDGADARLERFFKEVVGGYDEGRDRPDKDMTSGLSAHLHFGDISPLEVWWRTHDAIGRSAKRREDAMAFLREIAWREFCYNLLFHHPDLPHKNLKPQFDNFKWRKDKAGLQAWCSGMTGYPIVDAGMRQLWHIGWMHNRVRMIAASFLIKDLMIHWREGEKWFWDTLVDADLPNNAAGWQWVAGSGADAAPYFRVFNPVTQGKKFDPSAAYVRKWVPEIASLPDKYIHEPWVAPPEVLEACGVVLGKDYPEPVVSHAMARMRALEAYEKIKAPKPDATK